MKLELLTNATVVDDAIRFVINKQQSNQNIHSSCSINKEEKQGVHDNREEKVTETTINQVF